MNKQALLTIDYASHFYDKRLPQLSNTCSNDLPPLRSSPHSFSVLADINLNYIILDPCPKRLGPYVVVNQNHSIKVRNFPLSLYLVHGPPPTAK